MLLDQTCCEFGVNVYLFFTNNISKQELEIICQSTFRFFLVFPAESLLEVLQKAGQLGHLRQIGAPLDPCHTHIGTQMTTDLGTQNRLLEMLANSWKATANEQNELRCEASSILQILESQIQKYIARYTLHPSTFFLPKNSRVLKDPRNHGTQTICQGDTQYHTFRGAGPGGHAHLTSDVPTSGAPRIEFSDTV